MTTLHDDALRSLRDWVAPDDEQERRRVHLVCHLEENPDGMARSCFPAHVTAGTLVISADGSHVLLNLHAKAQRWFAFGGHSEPEDRTLSEVAHREALEESGVTGLLFDPVPVQLNSHPVPFCDTRGTVTHLDVRYVAVAPPDARPVTSSESLDVRWWPVEVLPDGLEADMRELIALARARIR